MKNINPAGEIITCPTCGAAAITLPCRKPFVPSIKCIDSIDGDAWHNVNRIIKQAKEIYDGYPAELDAINYIFQSIEEAKR